MKLSPCLSPPQWGQVFPFSFNSLWLLSPKKQGTIYTQNSISIYKSGDNDLLINNINKLGVTNSMVTIVVTKGSVL